MKFGMQASHNEKQGGRINIYFNIEQLFHFLNCLHMLGKLNSQHTYKSCLSREHAQYLNVV